MLDFINIVVFNSLINTELLKYLLNLRFMLNNIYLLTI